MYRKNVLSFAYDCCKSNKGTAGVDDQTFEDIEAYGLERWLGELTQELKGRTYQPAAVRRVYIPKPDGKTRPLGIPTVKDRVAQMLSHLYMRRFVLGWKALGHERRLDAHIVNYADDFVICCRHRADEALVVMRDMMSKLKLKVNEVKTHVCQLPRETFDFLGYTFGRCYSPRTGRAYIGTKPARKRVARVCTEIGELTDRNKTWQDTEQVVKQLNRTISGWANYFCLGPVSHAYRAVDHHARYRLCQWLRKKHKMRAGVKTRFTNDYLHQTLGLIRLGPWTASFPWAGT